jgi:hypothetical protein
MVRGSILLRAFFFSFPNRAKGLWGPPILLLRGCRRSFLGVKRAGCEVNHSSLSSAEVKNEWTAITFVITKYEGGAFEGPGVDERRTLKSIERHEIDKGVRLSCNWVKWRAPGRTKMNFRIPWNGGSFIPSYANFSCSKKGCALWH